MQVSYKTNFATLSNEQQKDRLNSQVGLGLWDELERDLGSLLTQLRFGTLGDTHASDLTNTVLDVLLHASMDGLTAEVPEDHPLKNGQWKGWANRLLKVASYHPHVCTTMVKRLGTCPLNNRSELAKQAALSEYFSEEVMLEAVLEHADVHVQRELFQFVLRNRQGTVDENNALQQKLDAAEADVARLREIENQLDTPASIETTRRRVVASFNGTLKACAATRSRILRAEETLKRELEKEKARLDEATLSANALRKDTKTPRQRRRRRASKKPDSDSDLAPPRASSSSAKRGTKRRVEATDAVKQPANYPFSALSSFSTSSSFGIPIVPHGKRRPDQRSAAARANNNITQLADEARCYKYNGSLDPNPEVAVVVLSDSEKPATAVAATTSSSSSDSEELPMPPRNAPHGGKAPRFPIAQQPVVEPRDDDGESDAALQSDFVSDDDDGPLQTEQLINRLSTDLASAGRQSEPDEEEEVAAADDESQDPHAPLFDLDGLSQPNANNNLGPDPAFTNPFGYASGAELSQH